MTKLSEIPDGQAIRLFNGAVDATNYERGYMRWASNVFEIGAEKGGTGTQRIGRFCIDGAGNVIEGVSGQNQVRIRCGGAVSMDIGTGVWSAGQWRSGGGTRIIGTDAGGGNLNRDADPVTVASGLGTGNGAAGYVSTEAAPVVSSGTSLHVLEPICFDYVITTGQPMMSLGGKTSAFPALKRSSAVMQARLADDSGFAAIQGKLTAHAAAATETIVPTKTLRLFDSDGVEYKVAVVPV